MFTRNQIDNWLELFKLSDNKDFKLESMTSRTFLKRDLVEAKVQVDRWNVVTTDWIFHSSKKDLMTSLFSEEQSTTSKFELKKALEVLLKYVDTLESHEDIDNYIKDNQIIEGITNSPIIENFHIWGATVHFTDNISPEKAIGLSLDPEDNTLITNDSDNLTNSIIVFNVE